MTWTGGFRAVGKTAESAIALYHECRAYQDAGAFAVEIEVVPPEVATAISQRLDLLLWSMGAGRAATRSTSSPRTSWARTAATSRATPRSTATSRPNSTGSRPERDRGVPGVPRRRRQRRLPRGQPPRPHGPGRARPVPRRDRRLGNLRRERKRPVERSAEGRGDRGANERRVLWPEAAQKAQPFSLGPTERPDRTQDPLCAFTQEVSGDRILALRHHVRGKTGHVCGAGVLCEGDDSRGPTEPGARIASVRGVAAINPSSAWSPAVSSRRPSQAPDASSPS
jgi:hypothetical protein